MQYINRYNCPLGEIIISADEVGLTGLWFVWQRGFECCFNREYEEKDNGILRDTKKWLDVYFSGDEPSFSLPLHFIGTDFQKEVWYILTTIPYGETMTYGEIANILAERRGLKKMSAQAVGGAVGRNKISIVVPCHRVIGANGNLVGYAGGIDTKIELLRIEKSYNL